MYPAALNVNDARKALRHKGLCHELHASGGARSGTLAGGASPDLGKPEVSASGTRRNTDSRGSGGSLPPFRQKKALPSERLYLDFFLQYCHIRYIDAGKGTNNIVHQIVG